MGKNDIKKEEEKQNNKVIHYCWFGGAPLSELTKKCIASWKKYLPDFEIKEWNETNFDINQCEFIKQAYEQKKWAFVADYTRFKVLEEYGGLYLDTDMEVTADISKYLEEDLVMGQEDSKLINAAVVWAKEAQNKHVKAIVKIYEDLREFNPTGDLYEMSVPQVLTTYFSKFNFNKELDEVQKLDNGSVSIYPMEYFYPLSYDYQHNKFTDNSCMIHHFDATWITPMEKFKTKMKRKNMVWIVYIIDFFINTKNKIKSFTNYMDVSIFAIAFLSLFFSMLATLPVGATLNGLGGKIFAELFLSFVLTFACKNIRNLELNRLLDINVIKKAKSKDEKVTNFLKEKEIFKHERVMFTFQVLTLIILNFGLTFVFANSLNVRELFTTSLITLLFTMIYVGIKKKMMYRILDLVAISFTLAGLSIISKVGITVSVVIFLILLVLLFVNSVKKKRIMAFIGSFIALEALVFLLLLFNGVVKLNFENKIEFARISDLTVQTETLQDSYERVTQFDFWRNYQNNLMENISSSNVLNILLSHYIALLVQLVLIVFITINSKDLKYFLLILPTLFVNLLMNKFTIHLCINSIQLFILFNIFVVEMLRKLPISDKIKLN